MNKRLLNYIRYLKEMGEVSIPLPKAEHNGTKMVGIHKGLDARDEKQGVRSKAEMLYEYYMQTKDCVKCRLSETRRNFVFGVGNADAEIMFIGEAPGAEEDACGIPFVGKAGKLLDTILAAAKISRDDVYIANIIKCRPPENRDPSPEEEQLCLPYLLRQIDIIKPKIICCLGRIAAHALLQNNDKIQKLRGKIFNFRGIPTLVTYHPAAMLRNDKLRQPIWEDFQFLLQTLEEIR